MQGAIRLRRWRSPETTAEPTDEAGESDAALATCAAIDRDAFATLYSRYVESVYRYCYHRLGDQPTAEDATSQVFVRALAALPRYRERGSFRSWLFAIAHNVVTDLARSTRRAQAHVDGPLTDDVLDPSPSPEEAVLAAQDAESLQALLATLPDDQRRVLELRLSGLSSPDVGRVLGRSPTAVRSLQFRAVERLRRLLADDGLLAASAFTNGGDDGSR
jgi:RNA polymerase sigma-70 factor (ECF subfamily)